MEKKILVSIAVVIIALAAVSTFFEFSQSPTGMLATPAIPSAYALLTFFLLVGITIYIIFRRAR